MNTKRAYLKNDPISVETLTGLMSQSVLNARLGSIDGVPGVGESVAQLKGLIVSTAQKVAALARDETRTEVSKHGIARDLATHLAKEVRTVAVQVSQKGEDMQLAGADLAAEAFAPRPGYGHLDAEIRSWMRDAVKTPEGMAEVSKMAKTDAAIAGIIYHSPHYLLGIAKPIHERLQAEAVLKHVPKAAAMVEQGSTLVELAKKYEGLVADVHRSFYEPALAEKTSTRVEV